MEVLTVNRDDIEYRINDPGGVIGDALRTGEPYEAKVLYHMRRRGFKGVAIDAGAQVGNHSLWLAIACGLKVYAFEPIDYPRLRDNLRLNDLNGAVHAMPVALGAKPGHAEPIGKGRLTQTEHGRYNVCTLDELIPPLDPVSVIKVDVEGMECDVLKGGERLIERHLPTIYAEAQNEEAAVKLTRLLKPWGYEHRRTFGATPLMEWDPC